MEGITQPMSKTRLHQSVMALAVVAALSVGAATAHADPVALTAAHLQLTPPAGWTGQALGPQVAQFAHGAIEVDVFAPVVDATHSIASIVREVQGDRALHARWRGRPTLRVVREVRGSMQRGVGMRGERRANLSMVWVPMGDRLFVAVIYLPLDASPDAEGEARALIDTLRPQP